MKSMKHRITHCLSLLTATAMSFFVLLPHISFIASAEDNDENTVYISGNEDFLECAKNCTLDSYSKGKTFILRRDLIFTSDTFESVPSFGGVFDGGGHSISGVNISGSMSNFGVFRCIEEGGIVKDLNISARVAPSGSASVIGGIAGTNKGTVNSCTFEGTIKANEKTGGIAGVNEGQIIGSSVSGHIESDHITGGIAGENTGRIIRCENTASVNTEADDISLGPETLSDFSINYLTAPEKLTSSTDTGGIAGVSDGTILICTNRGSVGYAHSGYNTGGIAGRQSGYISGCKNYGTINGRKDIGGIVGQSEPFTSLFVSKRSANELRKELDELTVIIDETIKDVEENKDLIGSKADNVLSDLDRLKEAGHIYANEADTIINDNIKTVNELSTRVSDLVTRFEPVSEKLTKAAEQYSKAFGEIKRAVSILTDEAGDANEALQTLRPALDDMTLISDHIKDSSDQLANALNELRNAMGDAEDVKAALHDLGDSLNDIGYDLSDLSSKIQSLSFDSFSFDPNSDPQLYRIKTDLASISENAQKLSDELTRKRAAINTIVNDLRNAGSTEEIDWQHYNDLLASLFDFDTASLTGLTLALSDITDALTLYIDEESVKLLNDLNETADVLSRITSSLSDITYKASLSPSVLAARRAALESSIDDTVDSVYKMVDYLNYALEEAQKTGNPANDIIDRIKSAWDFLDDGQAQLVAAIYLATDASDKTHEGTSILKDAFGIVSDINDYFGQQAELVFTGADGNIVAARDNIKELTGSLLTSVDSLGDVGGKGLDVLSDDFSRVNAKLDIISNIIIDMVEEVRSTSTDISDYTQDISMTDTAGQSEGKIASSVNYGRILGDLNIGGITGTMGVDNPLDPEGDLQIPDSISTDFIYKTRTVVRDCKNCSDVVSKRDNAGGIVGNMETGCVTGCVSVCEVKSTDGGYVGGIAGNSMAVVNGSYANCRVEGTYYVGGITGKGHDILRCRAFSQVFSSAEYKGSVAGNADGTVSENYFSENDIGGIDGISYEGKAAPMSYSEFSALEGNPDEFKVITLSFCTEDEDGVLTEVGSYSTYYGGDISEKDIPAVPAKDGYFGRWESFPQKDIRFSQRVIAEYSKLLSTIGTELTRDGRSEILAEGTFSEYDTITADHTGQEINVTLSDDGEHRIHYLKNYEHSYLIVNGERVNAVPDGSYLVFDQSGSEFSLIEMEDTSAYSYVYIAVGAGAALCFVLILIIVIRQAKKKKASKAAKETK